MMDCVSRAGVWGKIARRAWEDFWDRFCASDPGLIRLCSTLTTVGGVLLALFVLGLVGISVWGMVVGALVAMVAGFAVSDPRPYGQAVTLAVALPVGILTLSLGALLAPYRAVADLVLLVLIFTAVYVRRYGPRAKGLGEFAFQLFFVSQFASVTFEQLPGLCAIVVIAIGCSGLVRWGLVRATPERTLRRLRHAFRARLGAVVDAMIDAARAEPAAPEVDRATAALQRQAARLHQCALMIQSQLDTGIEDQATARQVQRRIAEAEIAAEHLGVLLLRALRPHPDNVTTLTLHLPTVLGPDPVTHPDRAGPVDPAVARLIRDLHSLRLLVVRPVSLGPVLARVRNRLLGYRTDKHLPETATGAMQEVYRGVGELARASMGLRLAMGGEQNEGRQCPETARSREELDAEDLSLEADEAAAAGPTGLKHPGTRAALQVTAGSAMAILGGELLSTQRWYWAMITCWVVYINTASVGEVLIKGYRRLAGTMAGALAGIGLATLLAGHVWMTFMLVILALFGAFYLAPVSYLLTSIFVTAMVGLLYTLLGTYSNAVLVLRIEETALGAASGLIAAMLVLPAHTGRRTDELLAEVLQRMREVVIQAVAQLTDGSRTNLLDTARGLDTALDAFRTAVQPLTYPASPFRTRRSRARFLLGVLETCAYHARSLAATAELVPASLHILADPRLGEAGQQLEDNLATLADFVSSDGRARPSLDSRLPVSTPVLSDPSRSDPGAALTARMLRHLQRLNESVLGLAHPLELPTRRHRTRNDVPTDDIPGNTTAGCAKCAEMR